jgi:hypothetical protein
MRMVAPAMAKALADHAPVGKNKGIREQAAPDH